jgi:sortase (surface protein transpeptidase)
MRQLLAMVKRIALSRRRVLAGCIALAVIGAIAIVVGVAHTSTPQAEPLPAPAALTTTASQSSEPPGRPDVSTSAPASTVVTTTSAPIATSAAARATQNPAPQSGLGASSIRIPVLGVTARIGAATVTNGVLEPPKAPDVVGAWAGSAALDAADGEVTLAGHVNWTGMAPFAFGRLADLHAGDLVYTTDAQGAQTSWRVNAVVARPKSNAIDASAFLGQSGPRKLVLITCGGSFNSSEESYNDNVYVTADPAT